MAQAELWALCQKMREVQRCRESQTALALELRAQRVPQEQAERPDAAAPPEATDGYPACLPSLGERAA